MKEKGRIGFLALVLLMVISFGVMPVAAATITIDPGVQYQSIEGWGTSLCWWGNVVGNYPDSQRNAINDLIFSSSGLGMNIVRYNIGGGENPSHQHMRAGGEMEGFEPSSGSWNWNADAGQRRILSESISRGVNIVEAFSNSPPYWMTNSGCASGATTASNNNLQDSQYTAFATYLTEVTKHFRDSWGITFRTLDPLNESVSSYWAANGGQEGCHFDRAKQNQIIKEVGAQLASKGLTGTKVSAPDESVLEDTITSYNSYDSTAKGYISQINAHTYGGSNRTGVRDLAKSAGKRLWMSEVDNGGGVAHNHNDIKPGLWLANAIKNDLKNLQPEAWVFWQVVENEQNMAPGRENSNWGLIHSDFENGGSNYYITKKYYVMGNYSKFIRPGYKMISCNDSRAVAAHDQTGGKLAIVYTNDTTGAISNTFDLSRFGTVSSSATVYRTSGSENLAQSSASISNKLLSVSAPANSVTTYVISLSGTNPTPTPTRGATPTPTRNVTPTPTRRGATPTPTRAGVTNLAQGKTASADSSESANPVVRGNDGSTTTRWCAANGNTGHWWKVDLGSSRNLTSSEVMWEFNGRVYKYRVETSTDNTNWTLRVDKTNNTSTAQTQTDSFSAAARYVRITVTGLASGTWASFFEFRVFGN